MHWARADVTTTTSVKVTGTATEVIVKALMAVPQRRPRLQTTFATSMRIETP